MKRTLSFLGVTALLLLGIAAPAGAQLPTLPAPTPALTPPLPTPALPPIPTLLPTPGAPPTSASVTGTGAGVFPAGAQYGGLTLSGSRFGNGLVINPDGTASGDFQTNLLGTTLLGVRREITVEGLVQTGALNQDGSVTFEGSSSVDLGAGSLPLGGVPFRVTMGALGIELVLGTTNLPTQTLSVGGVSIIRD